MPDRSVPPSDALVQIYSLAAERWKHWDALKRKERAAGRSATTSAGAKLSPSERRRVLRLRRAGMSLREIGKELGCSASTIRRVLREDTAGEDGAHPGRDTPEAEFTSSAAKALSQRIARIESVLAAMSDVLQVLDAGRPGRGARRRTD